jgi:hypothetical protein
MPAIPSLPETLAAARLAASFGVVRVDPHHQREEAQDGDEEAEQQRDDSQQRV